MLKLAFAMSLFLYSLNGFAANQSIQERAELVMAKYEIINKLGELCDSQLNSLDEKSIGTEDCQKYTKAVKSDYYLSTIKECKSLIEYFQSNLSNAPSRDFLGNSELEKKLIIQSCSPDIVQSNYKYVTKPLSKMNALKELFK